MIKARGKCPKCGYSVRLRASGMIGAHWLYNGGPGPGGHYCKGAGQAPLATAKTIESCDTLDDCDDEAT